MLLLHLFEQALICEKKERGRGATRLIQPLILCTMPVVMASQRTSHDNVTGTTALDQVVQQQLNSLDDTDAYASVWSDLLSRQSSADAAAPGWGGRGQGGRGFSRRTYQPRDVVVENVSLEYTSVKQQQQQQDSTTNTDSDQLQLPAKVLLEHATLKLLAGHVYALVGRNGVGKSTLLRRIQAGKIPGFPSHIAVLYIPQELPYWKPTNNTNSSENENANGDGETNTPEAGQRSPPLTVLEVVRQEFIKFSKQNNSSLVYQIELLEQELEEVTETEDGPERMEDICEELANLQDALDQHQHEDAAETGTKTWLEHAKNALTFFGLEDHSNGTVNILDRSYHQLSPGQRKKVTLAVALLCSSTVSSSQQLLLCLDEPTSHLDIQGLIQLRQFLQQQTNTNDNPNDSNTNRTVLLVSHDTDLLNDVATDVIVFSHVQKTLLYFPGNYNDYQRQYAQQQLHLLRQQVSLDKKRHHMVQNIHHLQEQPAPKRGGNKKKAQRIAAQRKKLEKVGLDKTPQGHRWTQQNAGTGIKAGALNGVDASTRKDLSTAELLKLAEASVRPPPDKAVQFVYVSIGSLRIIPRSICRACVCAPLEVCLVHSSQ